MCSDRNRHRAAAVDPCPGRPRAVIGLYRLDGPAVHLQIQLGVEVDVDHAVGSVRASRPGHRQQQAGFRARHGLVTGRRLTEQLTPTIQGPGTGPGPVPPFPSPGGIIVSVSVTAAGRCAGAADSAGAPARGGDGRKDLSSDPERAFDPLGAGLAATAPGWLSAPVTVPAGSPGGASAELGWWPSGGPAAEAIAAAVRPSTTPVTGSRFLAW